MDKVGNRRPLVVVIVVLSLLVLGLGGYIVYDKALSNKKESLEQDNIIEEQEEKLTKEELLDKITGEWGTCKDGSCRGIIIGKRENGEYYYTPYLMWSDGGTSGTVKKCEYKEKDSYLLTVYYAAYESVIGSGIEHTDENEINISEINSNIILINEIKYQKITTDREVFFDSIK